MKNPSIIYWKWDDQHLKDRSYIEKIEDIAARSCFDHVCITTHWCRNGIADEDMHDHVRAACDKLHELGRKMIFEIDVRAEKKRFAETYPDSRMGFIYWQNQTAGEGEKAKFSFHIVRGGGGELFSGDRQDGEKVLDVFAYETDEAGCIREESIKCLTEQATLQRTDDSTVTVEVKAVSGRKVFVTVCSYYQFPDFWSNEYHAYLNWLMKRYSDIPLDGLSVDELGLLWYPDFDFTPGSYKMLDNAPIYSLGFADTFEQRFGMSYSRSLLYRFCSSDEDQNTVKAINYYFDTVREGLAECECRFYQKTKELYGDDAFVGVHNTWYAIEEVANTPEVWKTGITWWSAKKDYGFTDEIMLYPVRTALAHKEQSPIFYNMWYGEATEQIDTYYTELWKNARFGGRTISLGYECTHEDSVLDLYPAGYLEDLSHIEEQLSHLDDLQESAANCEVLVLAGLEACCNRLANQNGHGRWDTLRGVLKEIFTLTRDIFNMGCNVDMVGSSAVYDQQLTISEDGFVTYGSQTYKYVIMAYPQFCKTALTDFLKEIVKSKTGLCVVGGLTKDFYGEPAALEGNILRFSTRPDAFDLHEQFIKNGVDFSRVQNGCVMQDGSIIFTAPAPDKPRGNVFESHFTRHGKTHYLKAEDIAFLSFNEQGDRKTLWSPRLLEFV